MNKYIDNISDILIKNGFTKNDDYSFYNGKCDVIIHTDGDGFYEVMYDNGSMFSKSLEIYWLIGVLIYYNYIDNFVK